MTARMDPVVLVARAVLLAVVSVLLGATAHLAVTGRPPGLAVVVVLLAAVFVAGLGLLRSPAGPARVVTGLVVGQGLVHLALAAVAAHAATAPRATAGGLALPVQGGRRVGSLQDSHDVATGHVDLASLSVGRVAADLPDHAPVLLVHLLAAVVLGLGLALAEGCLWALVALLSAAVLRLLVPCAAPVPARPGAPGPARRRPRLLLLLAPTVVRRGPPAVLGAA